MRRNRRNSLFISLEEETQCLTEETKELTPLEDEAVTVDIAKDEQAIEEISEALDECGNEVCNLTEQAEANDAVVEPTVNDVIQSEVTLEKAKYILGYYDTSKISLSTESAKSQLQVSTEGIREFISKIVTIIRDLIKKAVDFFKKLFVKLKLKLGGYVKKLENIRDTYKNADFSRVTDDQLTEISKKLNDMNLATVKIHMGKGTKNAFGLPPVYLNLQIKPLLTINPVRLFNKIVNEDNEVAQKESLENFKNMLTKGDFNVKKTVELQDDNEIKLGCSGSTLYTVLVDESANSIKFNHETNNFNLVGSKENDSLVELTSDNLNKLKADANVYTNAYIERAKNANKLFDDIDKWQKMVSDSISKIEKEAKSLEDAGKNNKQQRINILLRNLKALSVDYPSIATKIYISSIREYIAINTAVLSTLGLNKK